jgi:hypothetical protein
LVLIQLCFCEPSKKRHALEHFPVHFDGVRRYEDLKESKSSTENCTLCCLLSYLGLHSTFEHVHSRAEVLIQHSKGFRNHLLVVVASQVLLNKLVSLHLQVVKEGKYTDQQNCCQSLCVKNCSLIKHLF